MNLQELDRLRELANIGAGHAAAAFSKLVRRTILMHVPEVRGVRDCAPGGWDAADEEWAAGVFFELRGCLEALVCILFRAPERDVVVREILGGWTEELPDESVESVLTELGNILASHLASAIADTVGDRLLPSVPRLVLADVAGELSVQANDRGAGDRVRIDCELSDRSGEVGALIVLVPNPVVA